MLQPARAEGRTPQLSLHHPVRRARDLRRDLCQACGVPLADRGDRAARAPLLHHLAAQRGQGKSNLNAVFDWMAGKRNASRCGPTAIASCWAPMRGADPASDDGSARTCVTATAEIRPWPERLRTASSSRSAVPPPGGEGEVLLSALLRLPRVPRPSSSSGKTGRSGCEPPRSRSTSRSASMLYDVFDLSRSGDLGRRPAVILFRAAIRDGVLQVPEWGARRVPRGLRRGRRPDARSSPRPVRPQPRPRRRAGFAPKDGPLGPVLVGPDGATGVLELGVAGAKNRPRRFAKCPDLAQPELKRGGSGTRHFLDRQRRRRRPLGRRSRRSQARWQAPFSPACCAGAAR